MSREILLRLEGDVERPLELTFEDFEKFPDSDQVVDMSQIDPKRAGVALRLSSLLATARVKSTAAYLTLHASADDFHASIPLAPVREKALLIYGLRGEPLPGNAGGPVRFYVPDFAACHSSEIDECANVKFVDRIELSRDKGADNRPLEDKEHAALHERQAAEAADHAK